jgi:hypothetical protein
MVTFGRAAGFVLALIMSPSATEFEPRVWERQFYTSSIFGPFGLRAVRRITISEARAIALRILDKADEERRQIAQEEAKHGVDWALIS